MRIEGALLFSYPGSKWRLAPQYQRLYPRHRVYVDVFGGSAAMIAREVPRATEVYNDLDFTVYNVFAAVKNAAACEQVIEMLRNSSTDRQQYDLCKEILADGGESNVKRAWAFLVCGTIGFSGHPAVVYGWTKQDRQRRDLRNLPAKVRWWHNRLRNVQLENRSWQEVIDLYDSPDTFFFLDPPYLPQVLCCPKECYYRHVMGAQAHAEMVERLRKIQGYALICGYHHPLYTRLLFHWRKLKFFARETMGGKRAGKRQEIAWLNYESDGSRIEGNRLRIAKRYVQIMEGEKQAIEYVERIKRLRQLLK